MAHNEAVGSLCRVEQLAPAATGCGCSVGGGGPMIAFWRKPTIGRYLVVIGALLAGMCGGSDPAAEGWFISRELANDAW